MGLLLCLLCVIIPICLIAFLLLRLFCLSCYADLIIGGLLVDCLVVGIMFVDDYVC